MVPSRFSNCGDCDGRRRPETTPWYKLREAGNRRPFEPAEQATADRWLPARANERAIVPREMFSELSRRRFHQVLLSGVLVAPGFLRASRRPNILFCISDDQSYPHAGAYGCRFISTPGFDRVASEGVIFRHAFVSTPSCGPSRGSILTGLPFYRLREASMNHTVWPRGLTVFVDLLAGAGYHVGFTGKGWGPGNWTVSGRKVSPVGPAYNARRTRPPAAGLSDIDYAANFEVFLERRPKGAPFCFWVGFQEPHRPFQPGVGTRAGKRLDEVVVPGFLPDDPVVRSDLADYAYEIEYYDRHLVRILNLLEKCGELDQTIVVVTSDNGMAFPRAKANLYDYGTRMPMAVRWGEAVRGGQVVDALVSFEDLAPTFLQAAGLSIPEHMTGRSLIPLLTGGTSTSSHREFVVMGLERHFPGARPNGAGYPVRAIRTHEYLYIRNYAPEANPVGDHPGPSWPEDDPVGGYGDTDGSPTKTFMWQNRDRYPELFQAAFGKRPAEELYRVTSDPFNLKNLAADPAHAKVKQQLSSQLDRYLRNTGDPRATGQGELFDEIMRRFPRVGSGA